MVKAFQYILVGIAALTAFSSCSLDAGDIRLEEVYGAEVRGTTLSQSRINLRLGMANDSNLKITVREASLKFYTLQNELLELVVEEPVVLHRRSVTEVDLPLAIRFKGGLGSLTAIPRLTQNPESVRVSGIIRLRGGGISKKYELKEVPLPDLLALIGVSSDQIKISRNQP